MNSITSASTYCFYNQPGSSSSHWFLAIHSLVFFCQARSYRALFAKVHPKMREAGEAGNLCMKRSFVNATELTEMRSADVFCMFTNRDTTLHRSSTLPSKTADQPQQDITDDELPPPPDDALWLGINIARKAFGAPTCIPWYSAAP